jgi:hypothetical protein
MAILGPFVEARGFWYGSGSDRFRVLPAPPIPCSRPASSGGLGNSIDSTLARLRTFLQSFFSPCVFSCELSCFALSVGTIGTRGSGVLVGSCGG